MQPVRFIAAAEEDAATIIQLRKQVWKTTYRGIYPDHMLDEFDEAWHRMRELQRIRSPRYFVCLMKKGEDNVGYLTIRKTECIILQSLYVLRAYQHQGIGKAAFQFVVQYCKEHGAHSFTCYCVPENWNARKFYEKMGGRVIDKDLDNEESWMNSVVYQFEF